MQGALKGAHYNWDFESHYAGCMQVATNALHSANPRGKFFFHYAPSRARSPSTGRILYKRYVKVGAAAGGRAVAGAACTCKSRSLGSNQCRGGRRRGNGGRKSE